MTRPSTRAGSLAARQGANLDLRIQVEHFTKFFGIGFVPRWKKRLRVPQQFAHAHPIRQVAIFGQIADAAERADIIAAVDGVEAGQHAVNQLGRG